MINSIDNNTISGINPGKQNKPADKVCSSGKDPADAKLLNDSARLVEQALKSSEDDSLKIARAKELLAKDLIDTPENIRKAAENIIDYGI